MDGVRAMRLIEVGRVRRASGRFGGRLLRRLFTEEELSYCEGKAARFQHLACRFAAKAAVRGALRSAGLPAPPWRGIEIGRDGWGSPFVKVPGLRGRSILLSLTHTRSLAAASVVVQPGSLSAKGESRRGGRPG